MLVSFLAGWPWGAAACCLRLAAPVGAAEGAAGGRELAFVTVGIIEAGISFIAAAAAAGLIINNYCSVLLLSGFLLLLLLLAALDFDFTFGWRWVIDKVCCCTRMGCMG